MITATATVLSVTSCDRDTCPEQAKQRELLNVPVYPLSVPVHVTAYIPDRWHALNGRHFCSVACLRLFVESISVCASEGEHNG